MIRSTAAFLSLCMFLWVLPLGNFIKSSQEKEACGGGRAMHMCTMGMGAPKAADLSSATSSKSPKISFVNASSAEKNPKSSASGASNDFLLLAAIRTFNEKNSRFVNEAHIAPTSFIASPLGQVPKFLNS